MADETRESKIKDCQIQVFWQRFLKANPRNQSPLTYEDAWSFGDTPQMADELAALVLAGKKTATTSAAALYEIEQEALPQSGTYSVLLNGSDVPKAALYLELVSIMPFDEVTADFAFLEGEGDRTLAYWRRVHEAFFRRAYASAGLSFHDQMLCVCEKFCVVYQEE
ncbi:ASCH domain-containing protein [Enterococcus casseliflavus]|uniref:ASCH domain-containing protein n=1 Tax=Enterococcus casseliflavus TaxID=37734 RepID=UPI00031F9E8F|nr:ASCH domain-containing protein [Enterococcus casseliflavus]